MNISRGNPARVSPRAMDLLREVVEAGFRNSDGSRMVQRFEDAFARRLGAKYAIAVCNGTATMHCALAAAGINPGDEVIVPALGPMAPAAAVMHQGAVPVFADVDFDTFNIDPASVRQKVTPLTKAIIPIALYGLPADLDPIMQIARDHHLLVIEDNAECFLGGYNGRSAGTIGHCASFSFQSSKHLSCGDGGIVVTDDEPLATRIRKFSCFGYHSIGASTGSVMPKHQRGHPSSIRHDFLGWNYRMSELQAAVALEQTERMDELVNLRVRIGQMFLEAVDGCEWLIPQRTPRASRHSYWTFVCRLDAEKAGCTWDAFRTAFNAHGGHFVYGAWRLMYQEPMFQDRKFLGGGFPVDSPIYHGRYRRYEAGLCPVAEALQPNLLQFKTNYFCLEYAREQAEALRKTVRTLNARRPRPTTAAQVPAP
jgi:perosamine synthetase